MSLYDILTKIHYRKKDGHPLDRTSRVKTWFDPETRLASVIIKRLKAEDSGEYECVAVSQGGTSVSKTTLHVKCK